MAIFIDKNVKCESKKTPDILVPALRQYQHNDCSGLVFGYDKAEVERVINDLQQDFEVMYRELQFERERSDTGKELLEDIRILILRGKLTLNDEIHKRITLACK